MASMQSRDSLDTSELTGGDYRGRDLRRMNARGSGFFQRLFPQLRSERHRFSGNQSGRCQPDGRQSIGGVLPRSN